MDSKEGRQGRGAVSGHPDPALSPDPVRDTKREGKDFFHFNAAMKADLLITL